MRPSWRGGAYHERFGEATFLHARMVDVMNELRLIADRFAATDDEHAIDLATGEHVVLKLSAAGDAAEQARWVTRCQAWCAHRGGGATLIDYGVMGEAAANRRFEAWRARRRSDVPEASAIPKPDAHERAGHSQTTCGRSTSSADVGRLAEVFEHMAGPRPTIIAIDVCHPGTCFGTVAEMARAARLNGFVPVSVALLRAMAKLLPQLRGRTIFLIDDGPRGFRGVPEVDTAKLAWSTLLQTTVLTPRPHVLLVRPSSNAWAVARRTYSVAAEQPAPYGAEPSGRPAPIEWPVARQLSVEHQRVDVALQLLASGRHAAGERALRQAIGALARRHAWAETGHAESALASALLKRGRPRDANDVLDQAREHLGRAAEAAALIDCTTLSGIAWTDLARLDEAESLLSAASSAARAAGDPKRLERASLALARVAFWRGQYAEAEDAIRPLAGDSTAHLAVDLMTSRIAVGLGDPGRALAHATRGLENARTVGDVRLLAAAEAVIAFARLAVGDLDGAEQAAVASIRSARRAHDPLRAVRSRLLVAEIQRRRGRRATALTLLQRMEKLATTSLPPIVLRRLALLKDLSSPGSTTDDSVQRHASASGLRALALFAPIAEGRRQPGGDPFAAEIADILQMCQSADEEARVLTELCSHLRQRLHAVSVAVFFIERSSLIVAASDGARAQPASAERAVRAGITLEPALVGDRLESAAPVRYGGATIGAIAARWTIASPYDRGRASSLLTLAAAAIAPLVSATAARRLHSPAAAVAELVGVSAAIDEVRRAVERTADAPFAVLVEGESGSGKERVARALHRCGSRRDRPFAVLNCAALPDDLVESELFGHARGAFTGAVGERTGVFEAAHGGTLFLDEVGELSPRAQAKVLRVIQEGELRRVGENVSRRIDVRIVSATNRDIRQEAASGRFRTDLLYRLDVIRILVPPLRSRPEDIAVLAEQFWRDAAARVGSRATLSAETIAALARYQWPGNVRELQNVLAALAVRCPKRGLVSPMALPLPFHDRLSADATRLDQARRTFEERFVRSALARTGGHRGRAAGELGVTRQGLCKLMSRLGIRN